MPVEGSLLRQIRKQNRWTLREVAEYIGASQSLVSNIESGHRPGVTMAWRLVHWARHMGARRTKLEDFLPDEEGGIWRD